MTSAVPQHDWPTDPFDAEVVNYVPDEVCAVVATPPNVEVPDAAGLYAHVRTELNRLIVRLVRSGEPSPRPPDDPLAADLLPEVLRRRFGNNRAPLQPLRRSGRAPNGRDASVERGAAEQGPAPLLPWVPLQHARSGRRTQHMYFSLGTDRVRLNRMDPERRRLGLQSVRELVLLLNRTAPGTVFEPFGGVRWSIVAVAPNWLTLAFPFGCGCPGGVPLPAGPERHRWHFHFRGRLAQALQRPARGKVTLAVLDACPSQADVDRAAAAYPGNPLLVEVHQRVRMDDPSLVPAAVLGSHLAGCLPRWQWDMRSGPVQTNPDHFAMADHGLFVAGVVVDVLPPETPVHLVRVLNDHGVGDLFAITHALAALPRALLGSDLPQDGEPRLVVNLSLGIDLPIPARLLDRWLPRLAREPRALRDRLPDAAGLLEMLHANLADTVEWLDERGVLVVAATGNDALRPDVVPGEPPPPRFPARYAQVLGVAATRRDLRTAADYSNRGELASRAWPGDVATFGGNVVPPSAPDAPGTTEADDAIVGIFSRRTLPGGAHNGTGWVRWAGTSFSTPIVSAVAARLWAAEPELQPTDVLELVRGFAHHPHAGSDPDAPLETPVLDVHQR